MYYNSKKNQCAFCKDDCYYELCRDCYKEAKEGFIIKNDSGKWLRNVVKGKENEFYDENNWTKEYIKKGS